MQVSSETGSSRRFYAVGDVHGRHDLLARLLDRIKKDAERLNDRRETTLVFLGDYIDRGDDSRFVVDELVNLMDSPEDDVVLLRGNHEDALLNFLNDPIGGRAWIDYGGRQTLASYGVRPPDRNPSLDQLVKLRDKMTDALGDHLSLFANLDPFFTVDGLVFSHAGVNPNNPDPLEDIRSMVWGSDATLVDRPLPGKLLVHGHYDDVEPVHKPGRICVDTGAYYTGRLSAVRLDDSINFLSVTAADDRDTLQGR